MTIAKSGGLGKPNSEPVEAVARVLPKFETKRVCPSAWRSGLHPPGFWSDSPPTLRGGGTPTTRLVPRRLIVVRQEPHGLPKRWQNMAMRLFLIYVVVELAVIVALASTIGFGWTVLALLGTFVVGLALAGSQVKRHIRRLRSGLDARTAQGAVTDSVLVALGTVLVVIPGLASSVLGALLLLPPTRAVARPVVTAMALRRAPLITVATAAAGHRPAVRRSRRLHRR